MTSVLITLRAHAATGSPGKNMVTCLASCLFADSVMGVGTNNFYFAEKEWPVKAIHILHNASLVLFNPLTPNDL
jgi:hypothetical protein